MINLKQLHAVLLKFNNRREHLKRSIALDLLKWKASDRRKALLLRGARQVGKTWSVRELGKSYKFYCEINFEEDDRVKSIFEGPLTPTILIEKISIYCKTTIVPHDSLVFFDEIQACPRAIRSLRFFQEKNPDIHIIAAGSLLEFAISEIPSFGVGRLQSLFMYPMSFKEFLETMESEAFVNFIQKAEPHLPIEPSIFEVALEHYRKFLILGGFPEVVHCYSQDRDIKSCMEILDELILGFRDDFAKYKKRIPQIRIDETFSSTSQQAGAKFIYSKVNPNLPIHQTKDALELLVMSGLVHKVYHSSAQGIPLLAQVDEKKFKVIPCDVGLYQRMLKTDISELITDSNIELINKGALAEVAVGNEILAYSSPKNKNTLFYWHREQRGSNAEIDYLLEDHGAIIPVEVKAGGKGKMKSMKIFLDSHPSIVGVRVSLENET